MATATPTPSSILQPEQQQQAASEAVAGSNTWQSSGSVGPFFAVISVLIVLAVLSCYLGRRWGKPRAPTPLESITGRGCSGWVKRMCRQCISTKDVQVGGVGAKVMVCDQEENDCKVKDGHEVAHQQNLTQV